MQRLTFAAVVIAATLLAAPAAALNNRSFVSSQGSDSNACTRGAPCRTLQVAHDHTNPGGEINFLDPAGYGELTVTKAISIINDGIGTAAMLPPVGGNGITINAGAGDAISLRGLTIDGQGRSDTNGIVFNTGGSLTLRDCVVRRNEDIGLLFQPNGAATLAISDSVFESHGSAGVSLAPTGVGDVTAVVSRVEANNNFYGLLAASSMKTGGSVAVSVSDSVAANNASVGFYAFSETIPSTITLMRAVAANNNNFGLYAYGAAAVVRVGESMVTDNASGWFVGAGGQVQSYGTNQIDGNGSADDFTSDIPLD
jgi:hypothetical protein